MLLQYVESRSTIKCSGASCKCAKCKNIIFECFIWSHFIICPAMWHSCSLADNKQIESAQKRALRYIYNDYVSSYAELRERCNKPLLYVHRIKLILVEVYKIVNMLDQNIYTKCLLFMIQPLIWEILWILSCQNLISLSMVKTLSLILVQRYGIYLILKQNKLLI